MITSLSNSDALHHDLDQLHLWSIQNQVPLNISKWHILSICQEICCQYRLNNNCLIKRNNERDLRITAQNNLSWSKSCRAASNEAFKHLGILRRTLGRFKPYLSVILANLYIRSHMEYAAQVRSLWFFKRSLTTGKTTKFSIQVGTWALEHTGAKKLDI